MANNKVPIILGAVGGVVGVAGMVVGLVMGLNNKSNPGFKLTLDAGEHGTIDGERTKVLENQLTIQSAYSVQADSSHEFKCWCSNEERTQPVKYPFTLTQNTTFYADYSFFSPSTYTVSYDTQGGRAVSDTVVLEGKSVSRPETSYLGHVLVGWYEDNLEGKEVFKLLPSGVYEEYTPTRSVTLVAKWQPEAEVPTVTLNPNGGQVIGETSYTVNVLPYAPIATYAKHELLGWYKANDPSQTILTFPLDITENVTLVAKWNQVAFDAGMYHGINKDKVYATWEGIKLLRYADIPEPTSDDIDPSVMPEGSAKDYRNYEIDQWVDMDDPSKIYEPGKVDISPLSKDTKLYATWKHTKYNVTLHYGDEKVTLEHLKKDDLKVAPSVPEGWIGAHEASTGWYNSPDEGAEKITFPYEADLNADLDFYLKKEFSMGKVYLHVNEQPGSATYNGTEDWYYTEAYASRGSGFNKRGQPEVAYKEALGWARVDSDMGEDGRAPTEADLLPKDQDWVVRPEANRIAHLYPLYRATYFKLTFETNGGSEVSDRMVKANEPVVETDIPTTIKGGSQFLGWYKDETLITPMDWKTNITGDMKLYAKFNEVAWKITYHYHYLGQDKTLVTDDWYKAIPTYEAAGGTEIPENPSGGNEPFIGWSKNPTQHYPDKDLIGSTITANTDLYAVFPDDSTTCTVTVNPNDGHWSDESTTVKTFKAYKNYQPLANQDDVLTRVGDTMEKTDCVLAGWAADDSGSVIPYEYDLFEHGTEIGEGQGRKIILYANWKDKTSYPITFDASPGYFKYYNSSTDSIETTRSYVFTVNEKVLGSDPDFQTVYQAFLAELTTSELTVTGPIRDGFDLNLVEGAGWLAQGQKIQNDSKMSDIGSATVTANYIEKAPSNWWTDDWYVVSKVAEQGQAAMLAVDGYRSAYEGTDADGTKGTATKAANTFVGLERSLVMSDYSTTELRTRVIGAGQDTIAGGNNKALLTFDFIDCPIEAAYATSGNNYLSSSSFHNSTIRTLLRSALPDGIKQYMKTVTKYAIESVASYNNVSATAFNSDLFLLSAYEINGGTTSGSTCNPGGSALIEKNKGGENFFVYNYYSGHTVNDKGTSKTSNSYRIKYLIDETGKENPTSWWTRSPAHPDSGYLPEGGAGKLFDSVAFYVTTNEHEKFDDKPYFGGIWMWEPSGARGISPGFCIGVVK